MVSATFAADFTRFNDAVQKAEVRLKDFSSGIVRVDKDLAKFGNQFSGTKLIQDATLMAKAIEGIGGVSKLTAAEQLRVNSAVVDAIAKYKALGQQAPASLLELEAATRKVLTGTDKMAAGMAAMGVAGKKAFEELQASDKLVAGMSAAGGEAKKLADNITPIPEKLSLSGKAANLAKTSFAQMFGAFTAANLVTSAVTGLVNLGKEAFASASRTADLSAKLGIGTEAIQRMEFVAKQTGGTVEQFASAAFKLGVRLSGNSDSVEHAVGALGLKFEELKRAKPEQQFEQVVGALGKMQDATKRNELGVLLFGKSFESIAAGVAANYDKVAGRAAITSDRQIQALDRAGDAWDRFKDRQHKNVRGILGNLTELVERRGALMGFIDLVSPFGPGLSESARLRQGTEDAKPKSQSTNTTAGGTVAQADFVAQLQKAEAAMKALTKEQRDQIDAAQKLGGDALEQLIDKYGLSEEAVRLYTGEVKTATKAQSDFAKTADVLFGRDVIARANDYAKAIGSVSNVSRLSKDKQVEVNRTVVEAIETYQRLGQTAPKSLRDLADATFKVNVRTVDFGLAMRALPPSITSANTSEAEWIGWLQKSRDITQHATLELNKYENALYRLPGAISNQRISESVTKTKGYLQSLADSMTSLWDGISGGKGASGVFENLGAGIIEGFGHLVSGGITSLINKGIELAWAGLKKLGGLIKGLFGGPSQKELEGRAVVKQFEDQLIASLTATQLLTAGTERWEKVVLAVQDAYLATGRSAEDAGRDVKALWDSSKKGAEAAKAAAEQINAVLEEQHADQERLTAAIQKYGFTIEQLGPAFRSQQLNEQAKDLIEDWRVLVNSGINLTLVNEKMAESINTYLTTAIKTGTEVPNAFKPILQTLIDQGLLLDENGTAITDLGKSGVTFAETMTQGFDRVVLKLEELIKKLQGTGTAIDNIPGINIPVTIPDFETALRERLSKVSLWDRITGNAGAIPMAGGGSGTVTSPTLFMAGESGPEQFAFSGANKSFSGGAVPITVVLELDGRVLGRATAEYLPGALATMGVRVA
jgi:hypothetical protein